VSRNCHDHVAAVGAHLLDPVFLGKSRNQVEVLYCAVDGDLKFDYLRNEGYSAILDPNDEEDGNGLYAGDEVDGGGQRRAVWHQLHLNTQHNEMVALKHVVPPVLLPLCSLVRKGPIDIHLQGYSMLLAFRLGKLYPKRQCFRVPVSDNQLAAFSLLVPEVAEIDTVDVGALLELVVEEALQGHVVDHYLQRNNQVAIELQQDSMLFGGNGYFLGSHVEEGQLFDRVVGVDDLPALARPGQLEDIIFAVEAGEEQRQVYVVPENKAFFLVGQLPEVDEPSGPRRDGVPDLLVDESLLGPERVMPG
jgi:hypothetical protein